MKKGPAIRIVLEETTLKNATAQTVTTQKCDVCDLMHQGLIINITFC